MSVIVRVYGDFGYFCRFWAGKTKPILGKVKVKRQNKSKSGVSPEVLFEKTKPIFREVKMALSKCQQWFTEDYMVVAS